ncbi:hypothetical protein C8J25_109140 [Sphingomonas faeni]|uniref:Uncharacterized protein n=1 Tax=Sphingomonas faeni TaxID=185950 RepID=A0A2T5TZM8_9SPHN|nr:hypothetical protein C8J25_109140 [Sphingomonas faeni]
MRSSVTALAWRRGCLMQRYVKLYVSLPPGKLRILII